MSASRLLAAGSFGSRQVRDIRMEDMRNLATGAWASIEEMEDGRWDVCHFSQGKTTSVIVATLPEARRMARLALWS